MRSRQLLDEAFGRILEVVRQAVDGVDVEAAVWQPEPATNTIAWLVWHLSRVQDDHVAELADQQQVWSADDWAPRFGLPLGTSETGFGHTPDQVRAIRPDGIETLVGYLEAVTAHTRAFLATIDDDDLDRVVDTSYDPPVTMGVRLVSVLSDGLQHAGQARYLRGIHDRTVG
jgi:hypothetical protein